MKTPKVLKHIIPLVALAAMTNVSPAAEPTLKVGDPAPKLQVGNWAQGTPVNEFERDKAYVVEFWATWCGPCVVSIPHVNDLHNKFKDKGLVVIGQNVWERKPEAVAPFIKKMGDKMSYRVALDMVKDGEEGSMARTWMEAAGQSGIPTAFVVDKRGLIAWIGHPMQLKEPLLEKVLAGSFDVQKAAAEHQRRQKAEEQTRPLWEEFRRQSRAKEWDAAEAALGQIEKLLPEDERDNLTTTRFSLLLSRGNNAAAYKLAAQFSDAHPDDVMIQNALAWQIATRDGLENPDLNLAEKIARRANAASKGENAEILDTLARVLFMKGQKDAAVEFQQRAVALAQGDRQAHFQKTLDSYKAGNMPDDVRIRNLSREFSQNLDKKQWDKAERTLGELQKLLPADELEGKRFQLLAAREDYDGAEKLAIGMAEASKNGPMLLNELAWQIAVAKDPGKGQIGLAEKIARRANEATKGGNAEILDTLARVLFLKGQKKEAIEFQEKAAQFATGRRQTQFQATLDSYKADKLPAPY